MAYSKQTWDTTSYVNPTRMNHMEDGIYDALPKSDIVTDTITGQTNASGNVTTGKSSSDYAFLGVKTAQSYVIIPFNAQSDGIIRLKVLDGDLNPIINTNVNFSCVFLKL